MRAVLVPWFVGLGCAAAAAGDFATFAPIGYSEDRRYFAYEEFSIGDEATQPFAAIGLVDLESGTPASGPPWTAGGTEEVEDTVTALRLAATEMAAQPLTSAAIADPAKFLALIGDGVRDKGVSLTFALPQGADPDALGEEMRLDLVTLPAMIDDRCSPDHGGKAIGFALMLSVGGKSRELDLQDATEGTERCIRRFRIYGVVQPYGGGDIDTLVAVVSVYTVGFEGYDRRFMVIPLAPRQSNS